MSILLTNKKAKFEYQILENYQAGLALSGVMVKQIRGKKINLQGVFVIWQNQRLEIIGLGNENITQNIPLLLKTKEIKEIRTRLQTKGLSCVILNIKTVGRWLKADIAIVKGKKLYDKREAIKQRDMARNKQRGLED